MSYSDETNDGPALELRNVVVLQTVQVSPYISIQDIKGNEVKFKNGTYRHKVSGGAYKIFALGLMQIDGPYDLSPAVIYQSIFDKAFWIRPVDEFRERFYLLDGEDK